jgi:hypothetical protein
MYDVSLSLEIVVNIISYKITIHMKTIINLSFYIFCLSSFCSCNTSDNIEANSFRYEFRLLNENGKPSTQFEEGENIIFSFLIINETRKDIFLQQGSFDTSEFMKVYSKAYSNEGEAVIGKPYETIFCTYQNGVLVPASDTLKLEIPWVVNTSNNYPHFCKLQENSYLQPGKYKTSFTSSFKFERGNSSFETEKMHFEIDFEVK